MSVGLTRASSFAIKEEVTAGTYVAPAAGTDFVALRPGNELSFEPELLESDELLNDIGATKSSIGKEAVSGSHSAYLRHSGVEGQEPQLGVLWESVMGSKAVAGTEYNTVASSTTTIVKVDVGEGVNFQAGQALLVKDSSNGFSIRNVKSVSGDDITLNFALTAAPGTGVNLGKCVLYIPAASGHPTFSTTKYLGNGTAIESSAGNTVTEAAITADANGFGEVSFSFEGTKYFYNAITIGATSKFIDFTDDAGTFAASVAEMVYATPIELAAALETAMNAASTEDYTVVYNNSTGKFTIASSTTAVLSLLWNTGTNAANSIGTKLGFLVASNDTGSLTYTSDNAQSYAASLTPSYDTADQIIIKGAELFIGNQTDNLCICAQSVSLTVAKTVEDVDCICEETGVLEKIPTSRVATMSVTAVLRQYDAALLNALLNNTSISAMLNVGPKTGGNWVAGNCFNAYLRNCTVSAFKTTGDSFLQVELELRGFVTSTSKDLYVSFI
jgi:hypothetical protein